MSRFKVFLSAILAGLAIGLGGLVFLSVDNKIVGTACFTIGLFMVCTFGLHLFTGKVCFTFDNDRDYAINLPIIWFGNLAGTGLMALMIRMTRIAPPLIEKAAGMCAVKTGDSLISLFFLGVLCNICIYVAVEGYGKNPHELGKYLSIIFCIMVFILSGTEHCVADMFYFFIAGAWSLRAVVCILVITLGNCCGAVLFPLVRNYTRKA